MSGFGKFGRFLVLLSVALGYLGGALVLVTGVAGVTVAEDDPGVAFAIGNAIYGAITLVCSAAIQRYVKDVEKDK